MKYPTASGKIRVLAVDQAVAKSCSDENEERYGKFGPLAANEGHRVFEMEAHVDQVLESSEELLEVVMEERNEKPEMAVDERKKKNKGKETIGDESPRQLGEIAQDFILDPRD